MAVATMPREAQYVVEVTWFIRYSLHLCKIKKANKYYPSQLMQCQGLSRLLPMYMPLENKIPLPPIGKLN